MRRAGAGVERVPDGRWTIGNDHLERAAAYEVRLARDRPVEVEIASPMPLQGLPAAHAATWLDRELASSAPVAARDAGFGSDVRAALVARRAWLIEQGLAQETGGRFELRAGAIATLQQREVFSAAERLGHELGKSFKLPAEGDSVTGVLSCRVDLISGRFALIENARAFSLVPWRPVLERHVGASVDGLMRTDGISWRFGRARAGPGIS